MGGSRGQRGWFGGFSVVVVGGAAYVGCVMCHGRLINSCVLGAADAVGNLHPSVETTAAGGGRPKWR